jgi:NAD(P)-dependent dehydrogenase (short-subunit alcohol dehydrogenase family)
MKYIDLKSKVYLVTGANGRIGYELSKQLINLGAKVIMTDILIDKIKFLNRNEKFLIKKIDITKEDNIKNIISFGVKKFKKIDGIIHCAYPVTKDWGVSFEKLKSKSLKENLFNQLGSSILISKNFTNYFLKKKIHGKIIFISSIQGVRSPKFEHYHNLNMTSPVEYSVIKSGIISLTSYLAKKYKKNKISVNCISPGGIRDKQPKTFIKRYLSSCGTKGLLDPNDIVGTIIFLLSNSSEFINGQNITIDDGWSL